MRVLSNEYPSGLIVQIEQQKNDVSNQSFRSKQFNPSTTPMILRVGCAVEYIESLESYRVGLKFQIMIFNCPYFPLIRGTTNAHFPDGILGGCRCYNTYEKTTSMKHTDSPKTASFTTTPKVTLSWLMKLVVAPHVKCLFIFHQFKIIVSSSVTQSETGHSSLFQPFFFFLHPNKACGGDRDGVCKFRVRKFIALTAPEYLITAVSSEW